MEHGSFSVADAENAFVACERHGCALMVRLPEADPILARRLLDSGAHGFLIPYTEDADRFAEFSEHCFFPPAGNGVCPGTLQSPGVTILTKLCAISSQSLYR